MEVMRGTAVSFLTILTVTDLYLNTTIVIIFYSLLSKWSISMQQWYMHPLLSQM